MVCIYCKNKTSVSNSRSSVKTNTTWRRRVCKVCSSIFTTREIVDLESSLMVSVTSKHLEPFLRDKILVSIYSCLTHKTTAITDAISLSNTVISSIISDNTKGMISSNDIFEITYSTLKRFDEPASVYYRAHHRAN